MIAQFPAKAGIFISNDTIYACGKDIDLYEVKEKV